jgi:hypothetical protein
MRVGKLGEVEGMTAIAWQRVKKECEKDRRRWIKEQEDESDKDDWHKQRYGGSIQDDRCKCCQHEHEEYAADHAAEEVVLAELAKHQKPTPDHALVANDTNNVVIEKEAAAIQVVKPSNMLLSPYLCLKWLRWRTASKRSDSQQWCAWYKKEMRKW